MENLIIPSAIQRIRSFLIEMCGMKVKPWATTEETLAALHATLVARHACDIFWTSLRGLLETLADDLKTRQAATPGTLVDNELLDSGSYAALLEEIRAALACQTAEPATFRRLAAALSAPALGLLLFLGGAASVGCGDSGLHGGAQAQDASPSTVTNLPDAPITPKVPDAAKPEANRNLPPITFPDAPPATDAVAPRQSDGAAVTIQDIMDACSIPGWKQGEIRDCLANLDASWTTGIAEVLAGTGCDYVARQLDCFAMGNCAGVGPVVFDPQTTPICNSVPVYIGVRFV